MRINLIGAGRLGQTLGRLLAQQGHVIGEVLTRSSASAQAAVAFVGQGTAVATLTAMRDADLWLLAVPDTEIASSAQALAQHAGVQASVACHGSGAYSSALLAPLQQQGWQTASAHCLLSFAQPALAIDQFKGVVCALEGQESARHTLRELMHSLGAQCFDIAEQDKLTYHAAAVWATNFLPVLQHTAEQLWQQAGMPEPMVAALRTRLLSLAMNNVLALGPQGALTGPASRGDSRLVQAQTHLLTQLDPNIGEAYRALSQLAAGMAGQTLNLSPPNAE